jgi:N-methylhydantoinase A/oxoprolinase/acetone carboxylase beta subunit
VLSAVGLLCSPRRRELVRSYPTTVDDPELARVARDLGAEARALVGDGARVELAYDCRYAGQSHELTVSTPCDFPAEHERRNGHARAGATIEVVAVRARATSAAPIDVASLPAVERASVHGPAVVAEPDCTVWVPDGWRADPRQLGAWVLERA